MKLRRLRIIARSQLGKLALIDRRLETQFNPPRSSLPVSLGKPALDYPHDERRELPLGERQHEVVRTAQAEKKIVAPGPYSAACRACLWSGGRSLKPTSPILPGACRLGCHPYRNTGNGPIDACASVNRS